MFNVLIAEKNLNFCKHLIDTLRLNRNIKIYQICTNEIETIKVFNKRHTNIDVYILDIDIIINDKTNQLKKILNQKYAEYNNITIITSNEIIPVFKLFNDIMFYDYVLKNQDTDEIVKMINGILEKNEYVLIKNKIMNELTKIGYNSNYRGTIYLREAIMQMYFSKGNSNYNLKREIYPTVAKLYNKTINNIKSNIDNATYSMYYNCDMRLLKEYFCICEDIKPTIKSVMYTVLRKIS